ERGGETGNDVFELRGLDARDRQVALLRLEIGDIEGLRALPGSDSHGSAITIEVGDYVNRQISREVRQFRVAAPRDAEANAFFALPTVAATLASEAHVEVLVSRGIPEEIAQFAQECSGEGLLSSGYAYQCCYMTDAPGTQFINASGIWVQRWQNP